MFPRLPALLLTLGLLAPAAMAAKHRNLDVLVNPTVTFLGEQQAPADPELNPIGYRFITEGWVTFDHATPGITPAEREALLQHLVIKLRELGYVPADDKHPPRVAIGVSWGSIFIPSRETLYYNRNRKASAAYARDRSRNKDDLERAQSAIEFLGANPLPMRWRPDFDAWFDMLTIWPDLSTAARDRITRICSDDVYALSVTAMDYRNAFAGRAVVLWQTRALAPARKLGGDEALHRMLEAIAPLFGTAATYPNRVKADRDDAEAALRFGFEDPSAVPAPVDLAPLIAHDFGSQ